jgi:hypothetical protein
MAYSFDQVYVPLNSTLLGTLSLEVQAIIDGVVSHNSSATELDVLTALYDSAFNGGSPVVEPADIYKYILAEISDIDSNDQMIMGTSLAQADRSSWLWIRGAIGVNSDDGEYFSEFIRNYTNEQFSLREGSQLNENSIQEASDDIAKQVTLDILANGVLPGIQQIGGKDAGAIAAGIFGGNYSPWAGTILFPFLGEGSFTRDWLLNIGTSDKKLVSGTYDLVSVAAVAHSITNAIEAWLNSDNIQDTIDNNSIGRAATLQLLEDLRSEANTFFQNAYGLPDEENYQIGGDLPLYGDTSLSSAYEYLVHPNYMVGLLGDDTEGITTTPLTDIVNAGVGDDLIKGSYGNDLVDGAEGTDTLDFSQYQGEGITLSDEQVSGTLYDKRIVINGNAFISDLKSYVYGVEKFKFTQYDDKLILKSENSGISYVDLGAGDDKVNSSALGLEIHLGAGNDVVERAGSGSIIYTGSGEDEINAAIKDGGQVYLADLDSSDKILNFGEVLTGGSKWYSSENAWTNWTEGSSTGSTNSEN